MIVHYVPKTRFLDPDNGIDWKLATDLYYGAAGPANPVQIIHFSDIAAHLADYHLDIGRTLGIKRLKVELIYTQTVTDEYRAVVYHYYDPEDPAADGSGFVTLTGDFGEGFGPTHSTHPGAFPDASEVVNDFSLVREFGPDEFLLLNLNFKNHRVGRATAGEAEPTSVSYTFADAAGRVATGAYTTADLGKVAYQADNDTYWLLLGLAGTAPLWQITEGPEHRADIAAGVLFNRPVCFFGIDAEDYDGVHTEGAFSLHGWYMSPAKDVWDNAATPRPPHPSPLDERVFKGDFGASWVEASPPATHAYAHTGNKINRWLVAVKVLTQPALADGVELDPGEFPLSIGRYLQDDSFDPWRLDFLFRHARWMTGHIDAPPVDEIDAGSPYRGVWKNDETYAFEDIVRVEADYYRSLVSGNLNQDPVTDPLDRWELVNTLVLETLSADTIQNPDEDPVLTLTWTLDDDGNVVYPADPDPEADPPGSDVFEHQYRINRRDDRRFRGRFVFRTD
jgi:hypothetical protein